MSSLVSEPIDLLTDRVDGWWMTVILKSAQHLDYLFVLAAGEAIGNHLAELFRVGMGLIENTVDEIVPRSAEIHPEDRLRHINISWHVSHTKDLRGESVVGSVRSS